MEAESPGNHENGSNRLLAAQGVYFLATGLWPLFSMRTFEKVTGPKTDRWLVRTVGVLVTGIGATLLLASRKKKPSLEAQVLALASAVGLAGIDVCYTARGTISPVYLADVPPELAFAAGAVHGLVPSKASRSNQPPPPAR